MNRKTSPRFWLVTLTILLAMSATSQGRVICVDDDTDATNNGSSWQDAYKYLQDAMMASSTGDEIRVAQGVYRPHQFVLSQRPNLGRMETFQLKTGVAIRGGYAGFGQADPNSRDIDRYKTILSGDLAGNDVAVNDPTDLQDEPTRADNSYHVVTGSGTDETALLDGFTITGGHGNGDWLEGPTGRGGAVHITGGSPSLVNCTLNGNSAYYGGALYNYESQPRLVSCSFNNNSAQVYREQVHGGGTLWGAAGVVYNDSSYSTYLDCTFANNRHSAVRNIHSSPVFQNCTFAGNSWWSGGAIRNWNSSPTMIACRFIANVAFAEGGALSSNGLSNVNMTNCLFAGNHAGGRGGAMITERSTCKITNCTFAENRAHQGSSLACDSYEKGSPSLVEITHCIFWDTGVEIWNNDSSMVDVLKSSVQGGWPGNVAVDPCFAEPGRWQDPCSTPMNPADDVYIGGDHHLQSQAGRWHASSASWVLDQVTSACIDSGDPMSPIGREPFPNGGIVNLGAYGGTSEASKAYFSRPPCETIMAGDINGDCRVDFADLALMSRHWLWPDASPPNPSPTIRIVSPRGGTIFVDRSDTPITIIADAADSNGSVVKVEFFVDGSAVGVQIDKVGEDINGRDGWEWRWAWRGSQRGQYPEGQYILTAKAIDNDGAVSSSAPIRVYVHGP
jgi:hypothetical protein